MKYFVLGILFVLFNANFVNAQVSSIGLYTGYNSFTLYPLKGQTIELWLDGNWSTSATTDNNGYCQFDNCLLDKTYQVMVDQTSMLPPWGGCNSSDCLLICRYSVGLYTGLNWDARRIEIGDVTNNCYPNAVDALWIAQRFTQQINHFNTGSWYIYDTYNYPVPDVVSPECEFPCCFTYNMAEICYGDINYSNTPGVPKLKPDLNLITSGIKYVKSGETFDLPIVILGSHLVGSISLNLEIPDDKFVLENVSAPNTDDSCFVYDITDGVLKIAWWNIHGVWRDSGDNLVILTLRALDSAYYNTSEGIKIYENSEISDTIGSRFYPIELVTPKVVITPSDIYKIGVNIYPNPANDKIEISYYLPEDGNVSLKIYDAHGHEVAQLINERQSNNAYHASFNISRLPSGIYAYAFTFQDFVKKEKLIIAR